MMSLNATYRGRLLVVFAAFALTACSAEEPMPAADADESRVASEVRSGSVLAEYDTRAGTHGARLSVHAQFIEAEGVAYDTALEALEVWHPNWDLDTGACSLQSGERMRQTDSSKIRLDLLDLGSIQVLGPSDTLVLEPRRLPDLLSAFSGVIYGTEDSFGYEAAPLPYQPGATYRFEAPGTERVDGFSVELEAPQPIRITSVQQSEIDGLDAFDLKPDDDLEVTWNAGADGAAVFLDLSSGFGPDQPRLTCRLEDDGRFSIPSGLVEQFDVAGGVDLALRRVRSEQARVDGFDDTEVVFSAVDELTVYQR